MEKTNTKNINWSCLYELPFSQIIAGGISVLTEEKKELMEALKSANPNKAILDLTEKYKNDDPTTDTQELPENVTPLAAVHGFMVATVKSFQCLSIHHKSLSRLVELVRKGDDKAFFDAIKIDRAIITCPTFAARIHKAEVTSDDKFFRKLSFHYSAQGYGTSKESFFYRDIRFAIACLLETGELKELTTTKIMKILGKETDLSSQENPANLRKFINRLRKKHSET